MKKPEILAPAGTYEALAAAVGAGADGVYIGAKKFNARQRGENFDEDEIKRSLALCHMHGVKLYVALNIALKERELADALKLAAFLHDEGIDGIIVQDLGLFGLLRKHLPSLSLHSSTQMFIHESSGVSLLCEAGFDRVVLARELTLQEIREIKKNSKCEIKIFCHGAMCISYSGQCYMSSMIGQRSGNRGRCAQPCRKEYSLYDKNKKLLKKGSLISPKDLNTLDAMEDIMSLGVDSLKIEGRLKKADYVYTVVEAYRKRIDSISDNSVEEPSSNVNEVFNRKFTTGYLYEESPKEKDLISTGDKGLIYEEAGRISAVEGYLYRIKPIIDIDVGDGIFIKSEKTAFGEILSDLYDVKKNKTKMLSKGETGYIGLRKKAFKNDMIYKTWDKQKKTEISDTLEKSLEMRQPVKIKAVFKIGEKPTLSIEWNDIEIAVCGEGLVQEAKNAPLSAERITEQLSKMKDSPFYPSKIDMEADENIFIPVKDINEIRRKGLNLLEEKIISSWKRTPVKIDYSKALNRATCNTDIDQILSIKISDMESLKTASCSDVQEIVYGWDRIIHVDEYEKAVDIARTAGKKIVLAFPRVIRAVQADAIIRAMDSIVALEPDGILVSSFEGIKLFKDTGLALEADDSFNIFNSFALDRLMEWNVENAYVSPELNLTELVDLTPPKGMDLSLVVHGNKELMLLQYNLGGKSDSFTLEDSKGFKFPVIVDDYNRTHIFNSKKLYLADEVSNIPMFKKLRIDALMEKPEEIPELTDIYASALKGKYFVNRYHEKHRSGLTKGHFKRGVL